MTMFSYGAIHLLKRNADIILHGLILGLKWTGTTKIFGLTVIIIYHYQQYTIFIILAMHIGEITFRRLFIDFFHCRY